MTYEERYKFLLGAIYMLELKCKNNVRAYEQNNVALRGSAEHFLNVGSEVAYRSIQESIDNVLNQLNEKTKGE